MAGQIFGQTTIGVVGFAEILDKIGMFRHSFDVFPIGLDGIAHDFEYATELFLVVRIVGAQILLFAVENGLQSEKLGKYATDGPNVDGFGVMTSAEQQLRTSVPWLVNIRK